MQKNMKATLMFTLAVLLLFTAVGVRAEVDKTISVLFVGKADSPRNAEYEELLKQYFTKVDVKAYPDFYFSDANDYDVLILDYKFRYKNIPRSLPANWSKPTVLIGSGDMLIGRTSGIKINWL